MPAALPLPSQGGLHECVGPPPLSAAVLEAPLLAPFPPLPLTAVPAPGLSPPPRLHPTQQGREAACWRHRCTVLRLGAVGCPAPLWSLISSLPVPTTAPLLAGAPLLLQASPAGLVPALPPAAALGEAHRARKGGRTHPTVGVPPPLPLPWRCLVDNTQLARGALRHLPWVAPPPRHPYHFGGSGSEEGGRLGGPPSHHQPTRARGQHCPTFT